MPVATRGRRRPKTLTDQQAFTTLFGEVCAQFNISVPVVGSNTSINGTNVTYPVPTASTIPFVGQAGSGPEIWTGISALLICTCLVFGLM